MRARGRAPPALDGQIRLRAEPVPVESVAWLALDADDHTPTRLLRHVIGALGWTLSHKPVTAGVGVLFLVGIIACIPFLQFSFLPSTGQNTISLSIQTPPGTPLSATDAQARKIEATLRELQDAEDVFVNVGGQGTPERASFTVKLHDAEAYNRVERELREKLVDAPGLAFTAGGLGGGGSGVAGRTIQLNL